MKLNEAIINLISLEQARGLWAEAIYVQWDLSREAAQYVVAQEICCIFLHSASDICQFWLSGVCVGQWPRKELVP